MHDTQTLEKQKLKSEQSLRQLPKSMLSATQPVYFGHTNSVNTPSNKPRVNMRLQSKLEVMLKSKSPDPSLNQNNLKTIPQQRAPFATK
jgi:hypothetical protein